MYLLLHPSPFVPRTRWRCALWLFFEPHSSIFSTLFFSSHFTVASALIIILVRAFSSPLSASRPHILSFLFHPTRISSSSAPSLHSNSWLLISAGSRLNRLRMLLLCLGDRNSREEAQESIGTALGVEGNSPEVNSDKCGATNHRWLAKERHEKSETKCRQTLSLPHFKLFPQSHKTHIISHLWIFPLTSNIQKFLYLLANTKEKKNTNVIFFEFFFFFFGEVILLQSPWFEIGRHLANSFHLVFACMLAV